MMGFYCAGYAVSAGEKDSSAANHAVRFTTTFLLSIYKVFSRIWPFSRRKSNPEQGTSPSPYEQRFAALKPLRVFQVRDAPRRIFLITDSINSGSLYGGVGTAIILSVLLARRLNATLCVATRSEPPDPENFDEVLRAQNIPRPTNVEFVYSAAHDGDMLALGPDDLFVTTSWWSTKATLASVPANRVIYLIQEDERMFYPLGDDHLLCSETLADARPLYVINSRILYEHFTREKLEAVTQGIWFEPSFPKNSYYMEDSPAKEKMNFVFYARPHNVRNLYYRGLEAIDAAITRGIFDPKAWTISFIGRDLRNITLAGGIKPKIYQNMPWTEYAAFIRQADLSLSLMYTPHPSYPPLDLASCGAIAVTNKFGVKSSLEDYSSNILCVDLDVSSLVQGLESGAALALNKQVRRMNYERCGLSRDWQSSFADVLDRIVHRS
jgi:hypothetical protein